MARRWGGVLMRLGVCSGTLYEKIVLDNMHWDLSLRGGCDAWGKKCARRFWEISKVA